MHTENPEATFAELTRISRRPNGETACYFYAKKALLENSLTIIFVRHVVDLVRNCGRCLNSTELGKRLTALNISIDSPEIPSLGIKGGKRDIQGHLLDFLKCFWNEELGDETSVVTNYVGTAPAMLAGSARKRYMLWLRKMA